MITETDVVKQGTPHVTGSGTEVWYTATGGITLIEENRTKSAHGDICDTALIWWNGTEQKVQGLWCADINDEGCTAFSVSWEGSDILMTGEWGNGGQRYAWKEIFTLSGPNAFTQTLSIGPPGGVLEPASVIHAKRASDSRRG